MKRRQLDAHARRLAPAVSFHEVVHPVLAEEAGVARLQRFSGGPGERGQECRLTPLDRERIVRQVESGRTPEAVAVVHDLMAGRDTPYGNLATLMAKAEDGFLAGAARFKQRFPDAVSCSGHGGALNGRLSGLKETDESAASLHALIGSRQFITRERAEKAGFVGESFEASQRFGMEYVSDRVDGPFTTELAAAIEAGRSAVLVVHPALVQRGHYVFEPVRSPK